MVSARLRVLVAEAVAVAGERDDRLWTGLHRLGDEEREVAAARVPDESYAGRIDPQLLCIAGGPL